MSNKMNPTNIELPPRTTHATFADLLRSAVEFGGGAERAVMSARALSAAEWTEELTIAGRLAEINGWTDEQSEIFIKRLLARQKAVWGDLTNAA